MNNLEVSKIIALCVLFILALVFGIIPLKVRAWILNNPNFTEKNTQIWLSCCVCFGGGVLFATVFMHIFSETLEGFEKLMADGNIIQTDYPIGEFTICLGFFLFYFMEEVIHLWVQLDPYGQTEDGAKVDEYNMELSAKITDKKRCESINSLALVTGCPGCKHENEDMQDSELPVVQPNGIILRSKSITIEDEIPKAEMRTSMFRSIMVVAALSVHGCMEGLAMGLEDSVSGVWLFCMAISLHKTAIAFSVGMELLEIGVKRQQFYIYIFGFATASPFGSLIGTLLYESITSSANVTGNITICILQAISGGAIVFVIFCEVLERERTKPSGRFYRFLSLFFGFLVMSSLILIPEPESLPLNSTVSTVINYSNTPPSNQIN